MKFSTSNNHIPFLLQRRLPGCRTNIIVMFLVVLFVLTTTLLWSSIMPMMVEATVMDELRGSVKQQKQHQHQYNTNGEDITSSCFQFASSSSTKSTSSSSSSFLHHHPDMITKLPGYDAPLPSPWYSGYLTYEFYNRTIHTHYTFVEAEDNELDNKPIIYWSNGGPGASSLFGLLTELGPLLLSDLSLQKDSYRTTGIPSLLYNPYTWTRLGHILVFDQPAPIGFSYCNSDTDSHSCGGIQWTDELTAQNALAALLAFQKQFPCLLSSHELYLTGESYAGIYIPTFAREIIQYNIDQTDTNNENNKINLKGFAVGDGCLGTETDICLSLKPNHKNNKIKNNHHNDTSTTTTTTENDLFYDYWLLYFLVGHGQIPPTTFQRAVEVCSSSSKDGNQTELLSVACQESLELVKEQVGGVYDYGLYDECTYSNGLLQQYVNKIQQMNSMNENNTNMDIVDTSNLYTSSSRQRQLTNDGTILKGGLNDYPCGGDIVMEKLYLPLPSVRDAFHITSDVTWFSVDNAGLDFDYTPTEPDLTIFYKNLINGDKNVKVLIYNGDTDPAITSFAAQNWTSKLGFAIQEDWRPWTVDGCRRIGGYITRYNGHFDYLTIRGAGHMVPTHKAAAAFTFLKSWILNENYPLYDKDCVAPSHPMN